jgi:cyclophilin family peptidyl-prolyl cis-trans isomerase/HEAT repeat protein
MPGLLIGLALLAGTAGCATAPPVPPVITYEMKLAWILRLEDQRLLRDPAPAMPAPVPSGRRQLLPAPPPPDLVRLLADPDRRIRRRAALAAGRVGLPDAVPGLATLLLSDPEPEVREMAALALGLLASGEGATPLRQALGDPSPLVQGRAAEALGLMGDAASAPAIGRMAAAQRSAGHVGGLAPDAAGAGADPSVEAFRLGVCALARLKAYEPLAGAVLGQDGRPLVRWWPVAFALQQAADRRALPALMSLAAGDGVYARAFAARGLGAIGDRSAGPQLIQLVDPSNPGTLYGVEAMRALARLGDPRAAPVLVKIAGNAAADPAIRAEALAALGGTGVGGSADVMLDWLSDKSPEVRAAAFATLARLDPDTFFTVLSGLDQDPHWSVRAALAASLGTLEGSRALPRLTAMLKDQDARVMPAVLSSLRKTQAPGVGKILMDRLAGGDAAVRAAAATELAEVRPEGGIAALAAAYAAGQRDDTYVARAAALTGLAAYGPPAAAALRAALGDKDWAVRTRAAALLGQVDPNADVIREIRPAPISRAVGDYARSTLVSPSVSPHVFIDTEKGTVEVELAVLDAPLTCDTFVALARKGFFNGLAFHRVVPGFVIQGGDPRGDGEGGPGFTIRDEFNGSPYLRGTVGLARDWPDTGGSQFFIALGPQPQLDGRYTAFGRVVAGMDVVDRLARWDTITRVRVWDGVSDPNR